MDREVEKIFVDILKAEMNLPDDYGKDANGNEIPSVVIDSQNIELGNTLSLQVIIGMSDAVVISSNNRYDSENNKEIQEVIQRENIQVDLISRDNSARQRRWEVQAALKSILAQQMQEKYYFRIFRIPSSFTNASEAEGGSQLNRYSIIIPTQVWYRKTKDIVPQEGYAEYYDSFDARVDDENTVDQPDGLIEFNIS